MTFDISYQRNSLEKAIPLTIDGDWDCDTEQFETVGVLLDGHDITEWLSEEVAIEIGHKAEQEYASWLKDQPGLKLAALASA